MLNYLIIFLVSFCASLITTYLIKCLAWRFKVVDWPRANSRHIHQQPIPLLGGVAIFLVFFFILFSVYSSIAWPVRKINLFEPLSGRDHFVHLKQLIGVFLASLLLIIGGWLDDKYHLKPKQQIIWPILACWVVIISGVGINYLNNPLGDGYIFFNQWKIEILRINHVPLYFTPLADIFTFIWLMVLMYSTKLLDGLDGLVSGLGVIGSLIIFCLSLLTIFYQPEVGVFSIILAGTLMGFLFFNFHPAKIFLGEGGSLLIGFLLGILAIISGGKVATMFLILGIPIIDIFWVFTRRVFKEKRSPFSGDRKHFHFRLLDIGLSHKLTVIFIWLIAATFGLAALFLRTKGKLLALVLFLLLMIFLGTMVVLRQKNNYEKNQ